MIPVKCWTIFYGDGSTFSSTDGTWAEAPAFGVFAVVYYRVDGTRHIQMEQRDNSRYVWPDSLPKPTGAIEVEADEVTGQTVKYGLWVDNDTYFALFDAVHGEVTP